MVDKKEITSLKLILYGNLVETVNEKEIENIEKLIYEIQYLKMKLEEKGSELQNER